MVWRRGLTVASSDGSAGSCATDQFERRDAAVEPDIVAAILHDATRTGDRGAVASERPSDGLKTQPETDMGQIHRDLTREGDPLRASQHGFECRSLEAKIEGDASRDQAADVVWVGGSRIGWNGWDGATGDLTSSMATSLGIYTYILDETQIVGTAIPAKI